MTDKFVIDETVGEDGKIVLQLPPDAPHGRIRITIEPTPSAEARLSPEEETALDAEIAELLRDENLRGKGLTTGEILKSPAIGIWKDREDITDSVEYVNALRRKNHRERQQRD